MLMESVNPGLPITHEAIVTLHSSAMVRRQHWIPHALHIEKEDTVRIH